MTLSEDNEQKRPSFHIEKALTNRILQERYSKNNNTKVKLGKPMCDIPLYNFFNTLALCKYIFNSDGKP